MAYSLLRVLVAAGSWYTLMSYQPGEKRVLYLLFPDNGNKYPIQELVSYNQKTKERRYKPAILYHFPCKSAIGDFRFITVNQTTSRYVSDKFIRNVPVKDCRWINAYQGSGLSQYNQNSEFSRIYIVEKELAKGNYTLSEVKPEMGEYN